MKSNRLADYVRENGTVPLSWAGSTMAMDYLNIGDALSAVMVAILAGRDIDRVPTKSHALRMGCVGTIGHGFSGGEVWFWGTGSSAWANPTAPEAERIPFSVKNEPGFRVTATRGPYSEALLTGQPEGTVGVYGDPVWLLPRFYNPPVEKKWKLGVIVHLSELSDRAYEAHVKPDLIRYRIPAHLADDIHIINTVTPIGMTPMKERIDEIRACERIVSTSLHGMVFAESYGIPCLHFPPGGGAPGLAHRSLEGECNVDPRVFDLYRGLGLKSLPVYTQSHHAETDWEALMAAIDATWTEKAFDAEALIGAFPVDLDPLQAPAGQTIWDHPLLQNLKLQHDVRELKLADKKRPAA